MKGRPTPPPARRRITRLEPPTWPPTPAAYARAAAATVGFRRVRIIRMVMTEGAVLTVVGAGLGGALGLVTGRYLDAILTSLPGLPAAISFFVPDQRSITVASTSVLLPGILAAAYPAWLAARLPVAEALRADAE